MKPNFLSLSERFYLDFLPSILSSLLFSFLPSIFLSPSFLQGVFFKYIHTKNLLHAQHYSCQAHASLIAQLVKNPPAMQETPV